MRVHIHKRGSGKSLGDVELDGPEASLSDLKDAFYKKFHFYPERQQYNLDNNVKGAVLKDGATLDAQGVKDGSVVYFKDLGVQISWRLVYVLEYLGPILIVLLFWSFPRIVYGFEFPLRPWAQKLYVTLFVGHFLKREFESLFVHRFSHATMPIYRLPINCAHYWVLCGCFVGYFLCHPLYKMPWYSSSSPGVVYSLTALFIICEGCNARCHYIQRNLRPRGTKQRGIPYGCGFGLVSCANYMWESYCWILFSVMTSCATAYIFTAVAIGQMTVWALKRHSLYRKQFGDKYPRSRRAIFPFCL